MANRAFVLWPLGRPDTAAVGEIKYSLEAISTSCHDAPLMLTSNTTSHPEKGNSSAEQRASASGQGLSTDAPAHVLRVEDTVASTIWARFLEPYLSGDEPVCIETMIGGSADLAEVRLAVPTALITRELQAP